MNHRFNELARAGFVFEFEHVRRGVVIDRWTQHNLMPIEGLNHLLGVLLKGSTQIGTWYCGLYEGNYTPISTDTAATFSASATETTAYVEATRVPIVFGAVAGGTVNNAASKAEFTLNADKTIYGGFIASSAAKGATAGVLLSAIKLSSPKAPTAGDILRATAGFTIASL